MTPTEIARKLTEAQREVLILADPCRPLPAYALRVDHSGAKAAGNIRKMHGLFDKVDMSRYGVGHWYYGLTPLGLAVRAELMKEEG